MKKVIKIFPAPHLEIRVHVSDEMIWDYRECAKKAYDTGGGKCCDHCSWNEVGFSNTFMCELDVMERLLEEG